MSGRFDKPTRRPDPLMSALWWVLIGLALVFFVAFYTQYADAVETKGIGIDTSKKCKTMLANNYTTSCPSIEEILTLFPDTSPQVQIGGFDYIDGIVNRSPSNYSIDSWPKYMRVLEDTKGIWIDPPAGARPYLQMITIESNFDDFPIKGSYTMSNNTISMGTQRHVNLGCNDVIISADHWIFLTGDTMIYLQNDCQPEFTNFDNIKKFYFEKSYQDITTSYKYKLEKWIAETKVRCLGLCFEY